MSLARAISIEKYATEAIPRRGRYPELWQVAARPRSGRTARPHQHRRLVGDGDREEYDGEVEHGPVERGGQHLQDRGTPAWQRAPRVDHEHAERKGHASGAKRPGPARAWCARAPLRR